MILRQLFDQYSYTYTYLIADESSGHACLVDPVLEQLDQYLRLLSELNLKLILSLDTHLHADHITALGALREATGCQTVLGVEGTVACADQSVVDGHLFTIGKLRLETLMTPGHTDCSCCYYLEQDDQRFLFTGDTLLIRGTGRTDFQNGDPGQLFDSIHHKILKLPADTVVYPAHDYKGWTHSTLAEEIQHNPRLQLDRAAFIEHMNTLNLPDPKWMDVAIPANQQCGNQTTNG